MRIWETWIVSVVCIYVSGLYLGCKEDFPIKKVVDSSKVSKVKLERNALLKQREERRQREAAAGGKRVGGNGRNIVDPKNDFPGEENPIDETDSESGEESDEGGLLEDPHKPPRPGPPEEEIERARREAEAARIAAEEDRRRLREQGREDQPGAGEQRGRGLPGGPGVLPQPGDRLGGQPRGAPADAAIALLQGELVRLNGELEVMRGTVVRLRGNVDGVLANVPEAAALIAEAEQVIATVGNLIVEAEGFGRQAADLGAVGDQFAALVAEARQVLANAEGVRAAAVAAQQRLRDEAAERARVAAEGQEVIRQVLEGIEGLEARLLVIANNVNENQFGGVLERAGQIEQEANDFAARAAQVNGLPDQVGPLTAMAAGVRDRAIGIRQAEELRQLAEQELARRRHEENERIQRDEAQIRADAVAAVGVRMGELQVRLVNLQAILPDVATAQQLVDDALALRADATGLGLLEEAGTVDQIRVEADGIRVRAEVAAAAAALEAARVRLEPQAGELRALFDRVRAEAERILPALDEEANQAAAVQLFTDAASLVERARVLQGEAERSHLEQLAEEAGRMVIEAEGIRTRVAPLEARVRLGAEAERLRNEVARLRPEVFQLIANPEGAVEIEVATVQLVEDINSLETEARQFELNDLVDEAGRFRAIADPLVEPAREAARLQLIAEMEQLRVLFERLQLVHAEDEANQVGADQLIADATDLRARAGALQVDANRFGLDGLVHRAVEFRQEADRVGLIGQNWRLRLEQAERLRLAGAELADVSAGVERLRGELGNVRANVEAIEDGTLLGDATRIEQAAEEFRARAERVQLTPLVGEAAAGLVQAAEGLRASAEEIRNEAHQIRLATNVLGEVRLNLEQLRARIDQLRERIPAANNEDYARLLAEAELVYRDVERFTGIAERINLPPLVDAARQLDVTAQAIRADALAAARALVQAEVERIGVRLGELADQLMVLVAGNAPGDHAASVVELLRDTEELRVRAESLRGDADRLGGLEDLILRVDELTQEAERIRGVGEQLQLRLEEAERLRVATEVLEDVRLGVNELGQRLVLLQADVEQNLQQIGNAEMYLRLADEAEEVENEAALLINRAGAINVDPLVDQAHEVRATAEQHRNVVGQIRLRLLRLLFEHLRAQRIAIRGHQARAFQDARTIANAEALRDEAAKLSVNAALFQEEVRKPHVTGFAAETREGGRIKAQADGFKLRAEFFLKNYEPIIREGGKTFRPTFGEKQPDEESVDGESLFNMLYPDDKAAARTTLENDVESVDPDEGGADEDDEESNNDEQILRQLNPGLRIGGRSRSLDVRPRVLPGSKMIYDLEKEKLSKDTGLPLGGKVDENGEDSRQSDDDSFDDHSSDYLEDFNFSYNSDDNDEQDSSTQSDTMIFSDEDIGEFFDPLAIPIDEITKEGFSSPETLQKNDDGSEDLFNIDSTEDTDYSDEHLREQFIAAWNSLPFETQFAVNPESNKIKWKDLETLADNSANGSLYVKAALQQLLVDCELGKWGVQKTINCPSKGFTVYYDDTGLKNVKAKRAALSDNEKIDGERISSGFKNYPIKLLWLLKNYDNTEESAVFIKRWLLSTVIPKESRTTQSSESESDDLRRPPTNEAASTPRKNHPESVQALIPRGGTPTTGDQRPPMNSLPDFRKYFRQPIPKTFDPKIFLPSTPPIPGSSTTSSRLLIGDRYIPDENQEHTE